MNKYQRGQVWFCKLPKSTGSVQQNVRPCVIVSNDIGNSCSDIVIVVPLTRKEKTKLPTHYDIKPIDGLKISDSTVMCEQIFTLPKGYCLEYKGSCNEEQMRNIDSCLSISLGLCRGYQRLTQDTSEYV